jgi:hypothetical protein
VEGACEHGNDLLSPVKCWELLEWLNDWWLLQKGSSAWS